MSCGGDLVPDVTHLGCPAPKAACTLHSETCRALFPWTPAPAVIRLPSRCGACGRTIEAAELTVHTAVHSPTSECQALVCRPCWSRHLSGVWMVGRVASRCVALCEYRVVSCLRDLLPCPGRSCIPLPCPSASVTSRRCILHLPSVQALLPDIVRTDYSIVSCKSIFKLSLQFIVCAG